MESAGGKSRRSAFWAAMLLLGQGAVMSDGAERIAGDENEAVFAGENMAERENLLGEALPYRGWLLARGIQLDLGYVGDIFGNTRGGRKRGWVYEGLGTAGIEADLEALVGWQGGTFRVSGLWLHGRGPTEELVNDLQGVSNIEGYDSVRLYELWWEQNWAKELFSVRAGLLLADDEFAFTETGDLFLNASFGWPAFISLNAVNGGPAYFVSALGVRVRSAWDNFYVQGGVFDGDAFDSMGGDPKVNGHGTHWELGGGQGAFGIGEGGWTWGKEGLDPLPGTWKLGGWYHTADFEDLADPSDEHGGNFGFYSSVEQMLWREEGTDQGLSSYVRVGWSVEDRSAYPWGVDGGVVYRGLLPGRERDRIGFGVAYARASEGLRRRERLTGVAPRSDYEMVTELVYEFEVAPWCTVQPDVQWIVHPGGSEALDDAWVVGLRVNLKL